MHGVTLIIEENLSALRKVADMKSHRYFTSQVEDEDEVDFIDPMEEAFDNMQHPMELMVLNRAINLYIKMQHLCLLNSRFILNHYMNSDLNIFKVHRHT